MLTKNLLQQIADIDLKKDPPNYDELIENIDILGKAAGKLQSVSVSAKVRKMRQEYEDRDTDIHIVSYGKSGTTLTQMLLYQMTTDGNMDFEHLHDVSPWFTWCIMRNWAMPDLEGRRLFKSHDSYYFMSYIKNSKIIFLLRDFLDAMPSNYQQAKNYFNYKGDFEKFIGERIEGWFEYNTAWLKNEKGLDILYVHYEDLVQDKANTIQKIDKFIHVVDIQKKIPLKGYSMYL